MDGGTIILPPIIEVEPDYRRWSDNILHWQERPYVYPFSDKGHEYSNDATSNELRVFSVKAGRIPATPKPYTTMYNSDFVPKPVSIRRMRPTSIHRFNKPHPRSTFHISQATTTNRSAQKARQMRETWKAAEGIVPEIPKNGEKVETRLFPCIPRNARLTADRATKITNAVIKPSVDKKQPHLKGSLDAIMKGGASNDGPVYPFLPVKNLDRPALKPLNGKLDALEVPQWDGAPRSQATTTQAVYGRKRKFSAYIDPSADAVAPDVPVPSSKELMFKEYTQYPKYAPQMLDGYYNSMQLKKLVRPFPRQAGH